MHGLGNKREAQIDDEGDAFTIAMYEDGVQVAGCCIPDDGSGMGFELAQEIAADWVRKTGGAWGGVLPI